ncbi:MAG: MBL fold metallo-hydrolase [Sandaracinaceae bacterium]|nr:MBL fold metallo-hydrolase [Sandaracinaceae bacterium]
MALPDLHTDRLLVLVLGPGTGELIVVHAPPGEWLVIDGCRKQRRRSYASRALEAYGARPSIVVLTHPHLDHASGVSELIDQWTAEDQEWPVLGMVEPPDLRGAGNLRDDAAAYEGGVAEQAVSAILDRWERRPSCRWDLGADHAASARGGARCP